MEGPRLGVAGADVDEFRLSVVREPVPHSPATASCPPVLVPRLRRFLERRVFERLRGIAGDGIEAPCAATGCGVVRVEESARRPIAGGTGDDPLSIWRSGPQCE